MISAWHWVMTTVRLVTDAEPPVDPFVPTLITCRLVKIVFEATLPAVDTVAITEM